MTRTRNTPTRLSPSRLGALLCVGAVIFASVLAGSALAADGDGNTDTSGFSKANQLLFMTDHLANVESPATLRYAYAQSGMSDAFTDHIDLTVKDDENRDRGKNVQVDFLSGKRSRFVPEISNAHGNPVIMMFLQTDVTNMAQDTGGSWRYFQKRIKIALEHDSKVEQTQAMYDGHKVDAQRVVITPFKSGDLHKDAMGLSLQKRYVFTLSDNVPGGVIGIRAETPGGAEGKDITESVNLKSVDHDASGKADNATST